jgi:hypothetical protein
MMQLLVAPNGTVHAIYAEEIDLAAIGPLRICRASHVEPDASGRWWVDLSPAGGPTLGPFVRRSQALSAEGHWLDGHLGSAIGKR